MVVPVLPGFCEISKYVYKQAVLVYGKTIINIFVWHPDQNYTETQTVLKNIIFDISPFFAWQIVMTHLNSGFSLIQLKWMRQDALSQVAILS